MTVLHRWSLKAKSQQDLESDCLLAMAQNGIPFEGPLKISGKIERFSRDHKKKEEDEWYVGHSGISSRGYAYLSVTYGSWSEGSTFEFRSSDSDTSIPEEDLQEIRRSAEEAKRKVEIELAGV
ncbi:MAG: hypothetical protein LLG04_08965, partial [Parachlamydia sp.]|nr:hypothetical protein [Parachlamydia sp.]